MARRPFFATLALAAATVTSAYTPAPAAQSALSLDTFYCVDYRTCTAVASGGSGGYAFEWHSAVESYESGDRSIAHPTCPAWGYVSVGVTVTDGAGASVSDWVEVYCPRNFVPEY